MHGLLTITLRWFAVTIFFGCLCTYGVAPLIACQQDQVDSTPIAEDVDEPDPGLAALALAPREEDHDRLFRLLETAHILADTGAGYEAARVLAALALRAGDQGPGREALHLLESWGLSIDIVRSGTPAALNAQVAQSRNTSAQKEDLRPHVYNLLAMRQYAQAASVLQRATQATKAEPLEGQWGRLLRRFRVPIERAHPDASQSQLTHALQTGHEQNLLLRKAQILRVLDPEAGELARRLTRYLEPLQDDRNWQEENAFGRWVAQGDDDQGSREEEPSRTELATHAVRYARQLSSRGPEAAQILTSLALAVAPELDTAEEGAQERTTNPRQAPEPLIHPRHSAEDAGAEVFRSNDLSVRTYHLELTENALAALREDPKEYVSATFREGDEVYQDVGVRLKGGWGSFRMIDGRSKAGFTIKFNAFEKGLRFHGLRRIILNNGAQDPTLMHEHICYKAFRDAGIPAPRTAYATLTVNGEPYGLYVQIEAVTRDFLKNWFSDPRGNLYEGPGDMLEWRGLDRDTNQNSNSRLGLRRLVETIEDADDDAPWETLADHVSVEAFSLFLALEQFVGHWDGYTQTNNYRMYHDPETHKFVFFPHGADQVFDHVGSGILHRQGGILGRALVQTASGRQHFLDAMQRVAEQVWNEESLLERVAEAYLLIRPHVHSQVGKEPRDPMQFEEQVNRMLRFISFRRYAVLGQLNAAHSDGSWRTRRHHDHLPSFLHRNHPDW